MTDYEMQMYCDYMDEEIFELENSELANKDSLEDGERQGDDT